MTDSRKSSFRAEVERIDARRRQAAGLPQVTPKPQTNSSAGEPVKRVAAPVPAQPVAVLQPTPMGFAAELRARRDAAVAQANELEAAIASQTAGLCDLRNDIAALELAIEAVASVSPRST